MVRRMPERVEVVRDDGGCENGIMVEREEGGYERFITFVAERDPSLPKREYVLPVWCRCRCSFKCSFVIV